MILMTLLFAMLGGIPGGGRGPPHNNGNNGKGPRMPSSRPFNGADILKGKARRVKVAAKHFRQGLAKVATKWIIPKSFVAQALRSALPALEKGKEADR